MYELKQIRNLRLRYVEVEGAAAPHGGRHAAGQRYGGVGGGKAERSITLFQMPLHFMQNKCKLSAY